MFELGFKSVTIALLLVFLFGCTDKPKLYKITPVVTPEDAASCGKVGGHAALIANLDAEGNVTSGWSGGCVLEVK